MIEVVIKNCINKLIMINLNKTQKEVVKRRHRRVRAKIYGTLEVPRLSVFRSNKGMFIQLIDDEKGATLVSAGSKEIKTKGKKTEIAKELGKLIAKKALEKNIGKVVFDRSSYRYSGRVQEIANGARENGLKF